MPQRFIFRGAGGRFITREEAEELGIAPTPVGPRLPSDAIAPFEGVPTPEEPEEPEWMVQWQQTDTDRGIVWTDFEEDFDLHNPLFTPPGGVDAFRVIVAVDDNPDYPRGHASTSWIDVDIWPPHPNMIRDVDATEFVQIRFRRR